MEIYAYEGKSETDAIIDELLREFSSDGRQNTSHSDINRPSSGISESRRTEIRPAKTEQQERYEYEASVRRDNESNQRTAFMLRINMTIMRTADLRIQAAKTTEL